LQKDIFVLNYISILLGNFWGKMMKKLLILCLLIISTALHGMEPASSEPILDEHFLHFKKRMYGKFLASPYVTPQVKIILIKKGVPYSIIARYITRLLYEDACLKKLSTRKLRDYDLLLKHYLPYLDHDLLVQIVSVKGNIIDIYSHPEMPDKKRKLLLLLAGECLPHLKKIDIRKQKLPISVEA